MSINSVTSALAQSAEKPQNNRFIILKSPLAGITAIVAISAAVFFTNGSALLAGGCMGTGGVSYIATLWFSRKKTISFSPNPPYKQPLTAQYREHRLRDQTHVFSSLNKRFLQAEEAMNLEKNKSFGQIVEKTVSGKPILECGLEKYQWGVCHLLGRRSKQEDVHIVETISLQILNKNQTAFIFGICDGHDSIDAAEFVQQNFAKELQKQIQNLDAPSLERKVIIWNAIKMTFVSLNERFQKNGGTTATIAIILDNELWVANCGDSRIFINANGRPIPMTIDMKPAKKEMPLGLLKDPQFNTLFTKRILDRGGSVYRENKTPRIERNLAMGGAIGDHATKGVSARPVITKIDLSDLPNGSDLILVCDGITDVGSTRQIATAVQELHPKSCMDISSDIVQRAFEANSQDNLSCLIIRLK